MSDTTVMLVGGPQHGWDVEMPPHHREYLIPKPFTAKDYALARHQGPWTSHSGGGQGQAIPEGPTIPDHRIVTGRYLVAMAADGTRFGVWQGWDY